MRAFYGPGVGFTADFTHSRHGKKVKSLSGLSSLSSG